MENEIERNAVGRRTFLGYVVVAVGGFIGVVVGIPLIGSAVLPALQSRRVASLTPAGAASQFPIGRPAAATVTIVERDGWIERRKEAV